MQVLSSPAFLQYVVSPLVLAIVAALGWLSRSYLRAIRHQVENDHSTNLRSDVDRIIEAVERHDGHDIALAQAVSRIEETTKDIRAQVGRLERRLDAHIDRSGDT